MGNAALQQPRTQPVKPGEIQVKLADAVRQAQKLWSEGKVEAAEKLAHAILEKRPKEPRSSQILAAIAEKRGDIDLAIRILRDSLTGSSADALAHMNLCRVLRTQGRLGESRQAGEAAVRAGTLPEAFSDLGDTYAALGENDLALEMFERAVARRPDLARARLGLAHALLMKGNFRAGWTEYEWRYRLPNTQNILPKFKQPLWNGMPLKSSRLLLICEQGYGDCIQFARYLPMVASLVKNTVIGCGHELTALIRNAGGGAFETCERWELLPPFEFQITLSSLPMLFGTTLETIPDGVPYLFPHEAKVAAWRARVDAVAQGRKKVGIVWQGRPAHPNDRARSVGLGPLTPLLELENICPVSLQVGFGREQLAHHPARVRVADFADDLSDFHETAALISALDQVVTIDSAIAHLTGALAKPGLVMLPKAGEWRWLEDRSDSPWYPTLELVRQAKHGDWNGAVQRVIERLQ